jgi:hypothetical protein
MCTTTIDTGKFLWKPIHSAGILSGGFVACPKTATMTAPTKRSPSNLWSRPKASGADVEKVKAALEALRLTPTQLDERRKAAAERVTAFKKGVTSATLASRTD